MLHAIGLSLIVEIALSLLLAATLVYCAVLERKLTALRKGQDGLKDFIADLNGAITNAGVSLRQLKSAANGAAETLDARVGAARNLIDELSLLTAAGERIATRIEHGSAQNARRPAASVLPAAADRLENARPRILRPEAPRAETSRAESSRAQSLRTVR